MSMVQGWTVWCDRGETTPGRECSAMDQISGTKRKAGKAFALSGWKRLPSGRWLCPTCAIEVFPKHFIGRTRRL